MAQLRPPPRADLTLRAAPARDLRIGLGPLACTYWFPRAREDATIAELLTPRDVARLLRERGLAPRKSAGQNFVVDPNTVRRIVEAAHLEPGDTVVEIGPGLGSLTLALADRVERVVAVEIDSGFVAVLREEILAEVDNVTVVHADALTTELGVLVDGGPARLVANLPYNVATPLLFHALEDPAISDAFVMVQREVGERWGATPGDSRYSGVSLKLALVADVDIVLSIPRAVFHPVPNVDSVMVRVTRRPDAPSGEDRGRLAALIDAAFSQRRKTLRNTLRSVVPDPDVLAAVAAAAAVDLGARAETLDVSAVRRLDAALADAGPQGAYGGPPEAP